MIAKCIWFYPFPGATVQLDERVVARKRQFDGEYEIAVPRLERIYHITENQFERHFEVDAMNKRVDDWVEGFKERYLFTTNEMTA